MKRRLFFPTGEICRTMGFVSSGSFRGTVISTIGENNIVDILSTIPLSAIIAFQLQDKSNVTYKPCVTVSDYVLIISK
ncbi:hypothetical protein [Bacteroides acidifaciens]|uniref:hypothetical protein n=1 Tax=Bacteroides acidifaciens TaxID=85831 RepID=UPI003F6946AE